VVPRFEHLAGSSSRPVRLKAQMESPWRDQDVEANAGVQIQTVFRLRWLSLFCLSEHRGDGA
jgi:hypothetical protein